MTNTSFGTVTLQKLLKKMRGYSTLTVEAVADDKLPQFNPEFLQDTVPENNGTLFLLHIPRGLVEKYLVTMCITGDPQFV